MKAVYLTAGAAGMYCGSCMHDNALAVALRSEGVDCVLQPIYTPIRVEGENIARDDVFFGGIHVYLQQQFPWARWLLRPIRPLLDWSPLIRLATKRASATDASKLGALSISMLQGMAGNQRDEVQRFVHWIAEEMRPDAIVLSNLLIGGALPAIRDRLPNVKLAVVLQGDDIFLDHLDEKSRAACVELCQQLIKSVDHVIVNSRFYGKKMGALFEVPDEKICVTPLSIDVAPMLDSIRERPTDQEFRLGYLARIAPEKGFHQLVDAFIQWAPQREDVSLHAAGWLGSDKHTYLAEQVAKLSQAGLEDRFTYHGSPTLEEKIDFLSSLDLLCVPTEYEEPKGLFVLEANAMNVPVVQPNHGAFTELIQSTRGGVVVEPRNCDALVSEFERLYQDPQARKLMGEQGRENVLARHTTQAAAKHLKSILFPS